MSTHDLQSPPDLKQLAQTIFDPHRASFTETAQPHTAQVDRLMMAGQRGVKAAKAEAKEQAA